LVGKHHGHGALGYDVVDNYQCGINGDGIIISLPGVLVHPFGNPVFVAQVFLGLAPNVGLLAAIFKKPRRARVWRLR